LKSNERYFFGKAQKLKSRTLIQQLFTQGKHISAFPLKAIWLPTNEHNHLQAGVSVSKRYFKKATDRNKIKRRIREAYRLQKNDLESHLLETNQKISLFLIYTGKDIPAYQQISDGCGIIIKKLIKSIHAEPQTNS
jgi:ribonuclease P protein component